MEHFFWYIVLIVIILCAAGYFYNLYDEHRTAREEDKARAERAREELEAQDWRKVGVRTSYKNRNMLEVRFRDICPVCKKENLVRSGDSGMMPISCPHCKKRYERDMKDGIYTSGLSERARACFWFDDYYSLRLIEYELRSGAISESEAREKRQSFINHLNKRVQPQPQPPKEFDTSYRNDYLS